MTRAFTLAEVLLSTALVGVLGLVMTTAFGVLIGDVPRDQRRVEVFRSLQHVGRRIAEDVDAARSLPVEAGGAAASDACLIIQQPGGVVVYRVGDDEISRSVLQPDGSPSGEPDTRWRIPHGRIAWRPVEHNGRRVGVVMQTGVEHAVGGRVQRRFENARVLFVGALPAVRATARPGPEPGDARGRGRPPRGPAAMEDTP